MVSRRVPGVRVHGLVPRFGPRVGPQGSGHMAGLFPKVGYQKIAPWLAPNDR